MSEKNDRVICYLLSGDRHAAMLAVSLWSLRAHYGGPVWILAVNKPAADAARRIVDDDYSGDATVLEWEPPSKFCYVAKTSVWQATNEYFRRTLLVDCDTVFVGDFSELWANGDEVTVTRFGNWITSGKIVGGRIKKFRHTPGLEQTAERLVRVPRPAINTGLVGWTDQTAVLEPWSSCSLASRQKFLTDEIVLQLAIEHYPHRLLDDRYNLSPIYGVNKSDPRVWHFHGAKHGKHTRRRQYRDIWIPEFLSAWNHNFGDIRDWAPAGDHHLSHWMSENQYYLDSPIE